MKIDAYKTNIGLFIRREYHAHSNFKLNGQEIVIPQGVWLHLKDVHEITSLQVFKPGENKHVGWTLKISSISNDEIPLNLSVEQVGSYYDDDAEEYVWSSYNDYRALYKPTYEQQPSQWVDEPVEVNVIREIHIDNYEEPIKMTLGAPVHGQSPSYGISNDLSKVVLYEDIERMLTPEFLLHERPCQLAPSQLYSIIRNYVKVNINPKAAYVSSDYDFCFGVKKRIMIKPVTVKTEIKKQNGRSYATPKFNTKQVTSKDELIFEMAPKAYNNYPVLEQWHASNLKEMAEQLKHYLDTVLEEINSEATECEHCAGKGVIVRKIPANERNV